MERPHPHPNPRPLTLTALIPHRSHHSPPRSPLTAHRSPLTARCSPLTPHPSPSPSLLTSHPHPHAHPISIPIPSSHSPEFGTTYQTSQIGNRTLRWLDAEALPDPRPFFAYIGIHAPHYPAEPAPWHQGALQGLTAPRTPNYNVSGEGKAQHVRQNPPLSARAKCWQDRHFRDRWASLLAVDDMVGSIIEFLGKRHVLNDTFVRSHGGPHTHPQSDALLTPTIPLWPSRIPLGWSASPAHCGPHTSR